MRKNIFHTIIVGLSLSYALYASGNGNNVIFNKEPIYGSFILETEEKLLIKESDSNINYMFKKINDIVLDSEGNIFLLDGNRILAYDHQGKFIKSIGRQGQGPGEFIFPVKLFIDGYDNLYVNDQGKKLIVFDEEGTFKEIIRLKYFIPTFPSESSVFYVDKEGYIYSFSREYSESGLKKSLVKSDSQGNIIKKIIESSEEDIEVKASKGGGVIGGIQHVYSPDSFFCVVKNSFLCFGENLKYRLFLIDFLGEIQTIFIQDEKPQPISSKEKSKMGKNVKLPHHRPFFNTILSDEKGRIYVIKTKSILDRNNVVQIDIFSRDGQYLYKTELPYFPRIIENGSIFIIDKDEEGKRAIKKLEIRNYHKLHYH